MLTFPLETVVVGKLLNLVPVTACVLCPGWLWAACCPQAGKIVFQSHRMAMRDKEDITRCSTSIAIGKTPPKYAAHQTWESTAATALGFPGSRFERSLVAPWGL